MAILLAGLIAAILPTGYFNWETTLADHQGTASRPASNARCFFSQTSIQAAWNIQPHDDEEITAVPAPPRRSVYMNVDDIGDIPRSRHGRSTPQSTTAYESSILSILLLTFSFFSRSVKMFRTLSNIAKTTVRQRVAYWAASCLIATAASCRPSGTALLRCKLLAIVRPVDLMITLYLVVKLYLDLLLSEMADVSTTPCRIGVSLSESPGAFDISLLTRIMCSFSGSFCHPSGAQLVFFWRETLRMFSGRKTSGASARCFLSASCWAQLRQFHWHFSPQSGDRRR